MREIDIFSCDVFETECEAPKRAPITKKQALREKRARLADIRQWKEMLSGEGKGEESL
jgi:hypothetical protein